MLSAALAETKRAFDLKGRTARGRYLAFLTCASSLFVLLIAVALMYLPEGLGATAVYVITAIFYLPVTAAGVRRLHDVGQSGTLMLDPLKPLAGFLAVVALVWLLNGTNLFAFLGLASAILFGKAYIALICIVFLILTALTLMYFTNTMGQLLLPSDPVANKYGPPIRKVSA